MASKQKPGEPGSSNQPNRNQRNDRQGNARSQNQRGQSRPNYGEGYGSQTSGQSPFMYAPPSPLYSQPPQMFPPGQPNMSYGQPPMQQPYVIHTTVISQPYPAHNSMPGPVQYPGPPPPYTPGPAPGPNPASRYNNNDYDRTHEGNNGGRGRLPHSSRGRSNHSNNNQMKRGDSCTSINSVGRNNEHKHGNEGNRQRNEGNRADNEGNRQRNEGNRADNEGNRQRNERKRQGNEGNRQRNESNRNGNEGNRQRNEGNRHGNEGNRQRNQGNRQRNEGNRHVNEGNRQGNEGNRHVNEGNRHVNEGNRQGNEGNRHVNEGNRHVNEGNVQENDGNKHGNEGKRRGRGNQSGRGRGGRGASNMERRPATSVSEEDGGRRKQQDPSNRGKGQNRRDQTSRGRDRRGNVSSNKETGTHLSRGNYCRGRGQVRGNFPSRGMSRGDYGNHSHIDRASHILSQLFHQKSNFVNRRGCDPSIRRGRMSRGFRPGRFQRGFRAYRNATTIGGRDRTTSVTGSEYTDCTESVVSCTDEESDNEQELPDTSVSQLNTIKWVHQTFSHGRSMIRGKKRYQRKPGQWSSLISKRNDDNHDGFDDSRSIVSDVSEFSVVGNEPEEVKQEIKIDDIKLDDIFTIPLKTLTNRITRYKKNVSTMKNRKEDPSRIKAYEKRLSLVLKAKAERIKERDNESKKTELKEISPDGSEATVTEGSVTDDSENETQNKTGNVRKSQAKRPTAKGRMAFAPKKNKGKKSTAIKNQEPVSNENSNDVDVPTDKNKQTSGAECCTKEQNSKQKNIKDTKREVSVESDHEEEKVVADDGSVKEQGAKKKKKPRKRNRNKKSSTDENACAEPAEKNDNIGKENINDILDQLDDLILNERKEIVYTRSYTPEFEEHTDVPIEDSNNVGSSDSKAQKNQRREKKKNTKTGEVQRDEESVEVKKGKETKERRLGNEVEGPDVNEVFKFLVKDLEGKGTPEEIVRESGLFPFDCNSARWFRRWRRRFNLIERNDVIQFVLVLNKDASYCLDYIRNKSCKKSGCSRYHVCKDMLSGHCIYGADKCKYSHDFLDERNVQVSKTLGYNNVFSNDEISSILRVRFPHVCSLWMDNGECSLDACYDLHICPRFIFGKCLEGDSCMFSHDKNSEHNLPIMNSFNMTTWNDSLWKKMIYVVRQPVNEDQNVQPMETSKACDTEDNIQPEVPSQTSISEDLEDAGSTFICNDYLEEQCNVEHCIYIHSKSKLPYIWQIHLFNKTWVTMEDSEEIEQSYCDKKDYSNMIQMAHNDLEMGVRIHFKPYIRGVVNFVIPRREEMSVDARRLSTLSYKQTDVNNDIGGFCTQWRWYWQDNDFVWQLFEPDALQETLESKFLAKQEEYHFSRENYKFMNVISFNAMKQLNIQYGTERNILRRPLFVSSYDVGEKCLPQSLTAAPVVKVALPENWVPWDLVYPFELVKLNKMDQSFQFVSDHFYKTLDRNNQQISNIFRVQNHKLWVQFKNQEEHMQSNYQRVGRNVSVDKRYLFHGTQTLDAVRGISINNFDIRVSGTHGTVYGDGAYFATTAKYSHNYTSPPERFMFMVNVLVGLYTKGHKSYRRPPEIPGNQHELYDSCVNDIDDPQIFVVSDKNQFYPEYLIQYTDVRDRDTAMHRPVSSVRQSAVPPSNTTIRQSTVSSASSTIVRPSSVSTSADTPISYPPDVSMLRQSSSDVMSASSMSQSRTSTYTPYGQEKPSPTTPKKKDEGCSIQ